MNRIHRIKVLRKALVVGILSILLILSPEKISVPLCLCGKSLCSLRPPPRFACDYWTIQKNTSKVISDPFPSKLAFLKRGESGQDEQDSQDKSASEGFGLSASCPSC